MRRPGGRGNAPMLATSASEASEALGKTRSENPWMWRPKTEGPRMMPPITCTPPIHGRAGECRAWAFLRCSAVCGRPPLR